MTLKAGSLFSGIGGLDLAAVAAGFEIKFQVEIDGYCQKVLEKHANRYWKDAVRFSDIRTVTSTQTGYVDVLFGGFPCQDISIANLNASGIAGARSGLWSEFARLIGEIRPRAILLENVPAITHRGLDVVLADLTALGYDARWGVISASDAGAPHKRDRWWCVGYTNSIGRLAPNFYQQLLPDRNGNNPAQDPIGQQFHTVERDGNLVNTPSTGSQGSSRNQSGFTSTPGRSEGNSREVSVAGVGRDVNGLSARVDGHRFPNRPYERQAGYEPARLTERRLHRRQRIKALGNAVVPQVALPIFRELMSMMEDRQ